MPNSAVLVDANGVPIGTASNPFVTSGGGGGGGAVTIADGADVTQGAVADAAVTNPASSGSVVALLKGILTNTKATVLAAGSALIGKVGIDQTTPGTTNGVQINAALPAGTNVIGKTSIDQTTPGTTNLTYLKNYSTVGYETVAASQTAQVLGGTGATGDYLSGLLIIPATAAAGAVTLLDNATSISIFVGGGTTALTTLIPFFVPIGANSASGAWKVTTSTNVSVIGIGNFT